MFFRARKISWERGYLRLDWLTVQIGLPFPWMSSRTKPLDNADEILDIVADLPQLVATFDADGRLVYLNEAGRRLLRVRADEELTSILLSDLYPEGDAELMLRDALAVAAAGKQWSGRGELLTRRGERVAVTQHLVTHAPDESRTRAFTLVAQSREEAIDPREAVLAATLGFLHDLNNLLGPILAYASLVREQMGASNPGQRYADQILLAAERIRELAARVLSKMRPRTAEKRPVVLAELVTRMTTWLRDEYPHCVIDLGRPLSRASLLGDPVGLEQVILNLVKNAVESLPAEGGVVEIDLEAVSGSALRLTIRDNGYGMDEETQARIFEPFFSTKAAGTGVGLSVTREVIRQHEGTISVESTPGVGTTFRVDLPLRRKEREEERTESRRHQ